MKIIKKLNQLKSYLNYKFKKIKENSIEAYQKKRQNITDMVTETMPERGLSQKIIDQIHIRGNHSDGTNTYEIWGNSIAKYTPLANSQGMGPSALYDLGTGEIIHDYRR